MMDHQIQKTPPQDVTLSEFSRDQRFCSKCGYAAHRQPIECPARDYACKICKRFNHFETCCWFNNSTAAARSQSTTAEYHQSGTDRPEMEFSPPDWYVKTKAWVDYHFGGNVRQLSKWTASSQHRRTCSAGVATETLDEILITRNYCWNTFKSCYTVVHDFVTKSRNP